MPKVLVLVTMTENLTWTIRGDTIDQLIDMTGCKSLTVRMTVIQFTILEEMTGETSMMKEDPKRTTEGPVLQVTGTGMTTMKIAVTIGHTMINNESDHHPQEVRRNPDPDHQSCTRMMMMTSSHVTSLLETSQQFLGIRERLQRFFLPVQSIYALRMTKMCLPQRSQRRRAREASLPHPRNRTNTSQEDPPPDLVIVTKVRSPSLLRLLPSSLVTRGSLHTPHHQDSRRSASVFLRVERGTWRPPAPARESPGTGWCSEGQIKKAFLSRNTLRGS